MTANSKDALAEYVGAHLLVAETSGKVFELPRGSWDRRCRELRMRVMKMSAGIGNLLIGYPV